MCAIMLSEAPQNFPSRRALGIQPTAGYPSQPEGTVDGVDSTLMMWWKSTRVDESPIMNIHFPRRHRRTDDADRNRRCGHVFSISSYFRRTHLCGSGSAGEEAEWESLCHSQAPLDARWRRHGSKVLRSACTAATPCKATRIKLCRKTMQAFLYQPMLHPVMRRVVLGRATTRRRRRSVSE